MAPWVQRNQTLVVADCPPCMAAVSQTCVGGHEAVEVPCSQSAPYHCGQLCGRLLPCGNHKCTLACHQVEGAVREGEVSEVTPDHQDPQTTTTTTRPPPQPDHHHNQTTTTTRPPPQPDHHNQTTTTRPP